MTGISRVGTRFTLNAALLRWAALAFFITAWIAMTYAYPVYFQRDDADMLMWGKQSSLADCFTPTPEAALSHDGMFRPLRELGWHVEYRTFGLNNYAYQLALGIVFIFGMAFLFKLVALITDNTTAWLMILVWLFAFRFLLTSLFWFSDSPHVIEMLLACAGLYFLFDGLDHRSIPKTLLGGILAFSAFFAKEPAVVVLPLVTTTYMISVTSPRLKWGRVQTMAYSVLPLLFTLLYFRLFPFALHRQASTHGGFGAMLDSCLIRLNYYGGFLTSGITGVILLVPAIYYITIRLWRRNGTGKQLSAAIVSLIIGLAVVTLHLVPVGLAIVLAAMLMLPKRCIFLVPWAAIPFAALAMFSAVFRSYLFECSFAISVGVAIFARLLIKDLAQWWKEHIRMPAITYTVAGLALLGTVVVGGHEARGQMHLLKARSDVTMSLKSLTPSIRRIPPGATLVVFDYPDMHLTMDDVARLPDSQKILAQGTMLPIGHADYWVKLAGRSDIRTMSFGQYVNSTGSKNSRVFLWLMTTLDHNYLASLHLQCRPFASVQRGAGNMDLLELNRSQGS